MNRRSNIILLISVAFSLFVGITSLMPPGVYASWWWFAMWCAVGCGITFCMCRRSMRRRPVLFIFHLSLLLILVGGGLTRLTSERGTVSLDPGESTDCFISSDSVRCKLPVVMTLRDFTVERYHGMTFPRDFRSVVATSGGDTVEISMNHIGVITPPGAPYDRWRLYQTAMTPDGGTILTVCHDPWGITVTYAGYILFAVSGLLLILRTSMTKKVPGGAVCLLVMLLACCAEGKSAPAIPQSFADSLAPRQVLFRGETVPFEDMARRVTLFLTGKERVGELDANRFVATLTIYPDSWKDVPFLQIKDDELRRSLGIKDRYAAPSTLYTAAGEYRLTSLWHGGDAPLDKSVTALDEKVALLGELWDGTLYLPLPSDSGLRLSECKVALILWYDRIAPLRWVFILSFIAAAVTFARILRKRVNGSVTLPLLIAIAATVAFAWHWCASSSAPFVSTPDILFFTAVTTSWVSVALSRRDMLSGALTLTVCGALALVAWISSRTPQLTPLMPVLHSPWLSLHVSLVMASYSLLGLASVISGAGLLFPSRYDDGGKGVLRLTIWGVWMLGIGIWSGAMWANVSWGRYWAWDPKETWALVTMMLYAIPLHSSVGLRRNARALRLYLLLASLSIVMTYAGVNLLNSLHAYR